MIMRLKIGSSSQVFLLVLQLFPVYPALHRHVEPSLQVPCSHASASDKLNEIGRKVNTNSDNKGASSHSSSHY